MANNTYRFHGSRGPTPARARSAATRLAWIRTGGALLVLLAGLWAAGLTPLDAFGPPPGAETGSADKTAAPPTRLKGMTASAGRRITTISIETSDPASYVTSRPDPLTLFVDLRDVDTSGVRSALPGA